MLAENCHLTKCWVCVVQKNLSNEQFDKQIQNFGRVNNECGLIFNSVYFKKIFYCADYYRIFGAISYCIMSLVTLQIGQCGNQMGYSFFDIVSEMEPKKTPKNEEFVNDLHTRFFEDAEKGVKSLARAVLLDTEEKVINNILRSTEGRSWSYNRNHIKMTERGAGNNWAMGHNQHGPAFHDFLLDSLHKELEKCDQIEGFLIFGSVAGGSGSGLGSFASEALRDEYPRISSLSVSVWPFQRGEVAVQSYNSVLSLASMQNTSDAVLMFENDWLLKLCAQKLKMKNSSLFDLNYVATQQLANLLFPVNRDHGLNPRLNDILGFLVPHPQFKLIGLRSVPQDPVASIPFSSYTWPALLRSLRRMLLYSTVIDETYGKNASPNPTTTPPISLANLLILRGRDCDAADFNLLHKPSLPYASWVPTTSRLKIWTNQNSLLNYGKIALLANNGQMSASCIDNTCEQAWNLFTSKFYFHHYEEYGLSADDFTSAMLSVEQIFSSYKLLSL